MHIVIIGNGVAGMEAALTIRARETDWDITVVSEESDHFFARTALMWVAGGQMSMKDIEPLERDAYARLRLGRIRARATTVDPERKQVALSGGLAPLTYDKLLLACGSSPRSAPFMLEELAGVGTFVTLQDLAWLCEELDCSTRHAEPPRPRAHIEDRVSRSAELSPYTFRPAARLLRGSPPKAPAVIGGGLIGIEAVEVMLAQGLKPKFFVRQEWFWPLALDAQEAAFITDRMRLHGVEVMLDHDISELEATSGHLTAIRTRDKRYDADLAVVAIGVTPNTAWLRAGAHRTTPLLAEDGGIHVDKAMRTQWPDVFAAGDCASVAWWNGMHMPEQLWYTSRDQGRIAGASMLGDHVSYDRGLWYNSAKLMDIEYTSAGFVNLNITGEKNWFFHEKGPVESTLRIVVVDDHVVGFNALGRRYDHSVLNRFIEERRTLDYAIDHLTEALFDTEFTPPLNLAAARFGATLSGPAKSKFTSPQPLPDDLKTQAVS